MQVIAAGANAIVAGSAVFKAKDYAGGETKLVLSAYLLIHSGQIGIGRFANLTLLCPWRVFTDFAVPFGSCC